MLRYGLHNSSPTGWLEKIPVPRGSCREHLSSGTTGPHSSPAVMARTRTRTGQGPVTRRILAAGPREMFRLGRCSLCKHENPIPSTHVNACNPSTDWGERQENPWGMLASQSSPDLMSYLVSKTQDKPSWGTPGLNIWPANVHVHECPHSPWVSTNVCGHTQRHIHTGSYCKWKIRILILSWHHYFQESVCDCKYQVSLLGISNISKMLLILKPREVMASQ